MIGQFARRGFLRRSAVIAVSCLLVGVSLYADAEPRHIGAIQSATWSEGMVQGFREGLRELGYSEGRDLVVEWRYANGDYEELPKLIRELIQSKVELIVTDSTVAALAAKRATSTLPIVMAVAADPIGSGLVASLSRPGGNITGLTILAPEVAGKRLQLLGEAIPRLTRVAVLWNPDTPFHRPVIDELKASARVLSIELFLVSARTTDELRPAFTAASLAHAQAMYVIEDGPFFNNRATILKLASESRMPAMYWQKNFADEGGLMSYGPSLADRIRKSAIYIDKILKGAKPGDLPIEQPTKFELVVNLRAARAQGINLPEPFLLRADEVIR